MLANNAPIWLVLVVALISGLIGAALTLYVQAQLDERSVKRDVLRRVAGNRHVLTQRVPLPPSGEPFVALNEAFIVFANHPEVLTALENLRTGGNRDAENVVALIKRMATASGVDIGLDDAFIDTPFVRQTPQP